MTAQYNPNPTLSPFSSASVQSASAAFAGSVGFTTAMTLSPLATSSSQATINAVSLCRRGQEIVQEIVTKTTEIFQYLRTLQLPNGASETVQKFQERKVKLEEPVRQLEILFRKLRVVYDRVTDATSSLDAPPVSEFLPYEEENLTDVDESKSVEAKAYSDEERELIEIIQLKNRQLKDIINLLRTLVWEINTMMAMRRTGSQ